MKTNSNEKSFESFFKNKLQGPKFIYGGTSEEDDDGPIIDRPKSKIPPAGE